MSKDKVLSALSARQSSTFSEFCSRLGGACPRKGDTPAWRELFQLLEQMQEDGLILITREDDSIVSMLLTEDGALRIRTNLDKGRELFALLS